MGFTSTLMIAVLSVAATIAIQIWVLPELAPQYALAKYSPLCGNNDNTPRSEPLGSSEARVSAPDLAAATESVAAGDSTYADAAQALLEKQKEAVEADLSSETAKVLKPLERKSSLRDYDVTLWARRAQRVPSIAMNNITIVSHATLDRLPHLVRWCKSWRGPMSISIFVKPGQDKDEVLSQMYDAPESQVLGHGDTEKTTITKGDMDCIRRHVDVHTVTRATANSEHRGDESDMFTHYPFNVQRNSALDGTIGNWVFLLDIDFIMYPSDNTRERKVSKHFHDNAEAHPSFYEDKNKVLSVVPCVETVTAEVEHPKTLAALRTTLDRHEVCAFYGHYCTRCHLPTNLQRFVSGSNEPYLASYQDGYEPYVIANRRTLPRYDEKFIGRGWDKMSYFYELNAQGRSFVVMPGLFLMHTGRGDQPKGAQYTEEYMNRQKENTMLMHNFKAEMAVRYGIFNPDVDEEALLEENAKAVAEATNQPGNLISMNKTDWATISSSLGQPRACVSKFRGPDLEKEEVAKLEEALGYACNIIDCSPLRPGGLRYYPRNIILHADWAFDRYFHDAVSKGEPPAQACNFSGAAKVVHCASQCWGCMSRPTASKGRVGEALKWLCGPKQLENCPAILATLPDVNRTQEQKAGVLFSFYFQANRCGHFNTEEACFFDGAGMRVPCSRIPK